MVVHVRGKPYAGGATGEVYLVVESEMKTK